MSKKTSLVRTVFAMPSGERIVCWLPRRETTIVRTVLAIGLALALAALILSTAAHSRTQMLQLKRQRNPNSFTPRPRVQYGGDFTISAADGLLKATEPGR